MNLSSPCRTVRPAVRRPRRSLWLELLESRDAPAVLQGVVWNDLNGDGVRNAGEPGLAGRTVFLDANSNGTYDTGEISQTTGADGSYSFTGLAEGSYAVVEGGKTGWASTSPRSGPLAAGTLAGADWKHLGPLGGDVVATAVKPGAPAVILAALDSETTTGHGGLYRSSDGGQSWAELPFFRDDPVSTVVYAPDGTAYAGTFQGLFRSGDDGVTWTQIEVDGRNSLVYAIGVHPTDSDTFFVGLNPSGASGTVWKTTDGGITWSDHTPANVSGRAPRAVVFDPSDPNRVYLGFAGSLSPGALFTSGNGGATWTARSLGIADPPVWDFAFDGTGVLAAGGLAFGSQAVGLYRSTDHGVTWTSLANSWPERYARSVAVDPANPAVILVGTERQGVYRSTDGGLTWSFGVGGTAGVMVHSLGVGGGQVLAGTGAFGVLRSTDGGVTFGPSSAGIEEFEAKSVAVNPTNPEEMIIAYARLNTGGVLRSTDGGATWVRENAPATRYHLATFDPWGRAYVVSDGSASGPEGLYRRNADGTWTAIGPNFVDGRFDASVQAVAFDPANPDLIVAAGQTGAGALDANDRQKATIWRSADGGATWQRVYVASGWATEIRDLELLPLQGGPVLLAAVFDAANQVPVNGDVLRSSDGGLTWTSSRTGLPANFQGKGISASAQDPTRVYLANGYAYQTGLLYFSDDAGQTWSPRLMADSVNALGDVLVDPSDDRVLYANGGAGRVSRSQDGGLTFAPFDAGLDNAPVFYGYFTLTRVDAPTPRLVAATLAGVYVTELYSALPASAQVTVAADETRGGIDFGSKALPGEITGSVWEDENADGVWGGEFGRSGWTVYLDANNNGSLDVGETFTRSLAGGGYRFTGVEPGSQVIRLQPQFGFRQTFPVSNGGYTVAVAAGSAVEAGDFGVQLIPIELRGTKWNDADGDGVFDPGETPLAGWRVYVDVNANGAYDWSSGEPTAVTDAQGNYVLHVREPGVYLVAEVPQEYWLQTSPGDGGSRYDPGLGFEPDYGTWADRDPATPDVTDVWYDFRPWNGYANQITAEQIAAAEAGLRKWEQATGGRLLFTRNTAAPLADVIVIGTGDLQAVGDTSAWGGTLARGGSSGSGTGGLHTGVAWMDAAEPWETNVGNGDVGGTFDYFSVATHEVGHALGLGHAENLPWTWKVVMAPEYSREYVGLSLVDLDGVRGLYGAANAGAGFHVVKVARGEVRQGLNFGSQAQEVPYRGDLALDFGTDTSPVMGGYTRTTAGTTYTPERGYGWTAGTLTGVDRGTGKNRTDLTRDFVSTRDATFVYEVPNGTYQVTVTLGDASGKRDQMAVILEGVRVATVSTNSGQFKTQTFTVTVTDRQLTLRVQDLGGRSPEVALNALRVVRGTAGSGGSDSSSGGKGKRSGTSGTSGMRLSGMTAATTSPVEADQVAPAAAAAGSATSDVAVPVTAEARRQRGAWGEVTVAWPVGAAHTRETDLLGAPVWPSHEGATEGGAEEPLAVPLGDLGGEDVDAMLLALVPARGSR